MSLIDLKSDLSKFRSKNPKPDNSGNTNSPKTNSYGDKFSAYQPISNELIKNIPQPNSPKDIDLIKKLGDTKLDDILKESTDGNLVNSVSNLSPTSIQKYLSNQTNRLERISTKLSEISQDVELSNIDSSNVIVEKMNNGVNNNTSDIKLLETTEPIDETKINQSVILNKDLISPINNIINPDIALEKKTLEIDWEAQSALIDKSTDITNVLVDQKTNRLLNDSILNLDVTPQKLDRTSKIQNKKINETIDTTKYNGQVSDLAIIDSRLDIDRIIKTNPNGRHESDEFSNFSNKNNQELNLFDDTNASGFTNKQQLLKTEYKNNTSELGYDTLVETNYFDIKKQNTTDGFTAFADLYDTKYVPESSLFDWDGNRDSAPSSNYFDINGKNSKIGFHSFAQIYDTKYVPESSQFDWNGDRNSAPSINYFDVTKQYTNKGFHTFASELEQTSYNTNKNLLNVNASRFDWNGTRGNAPSVDYFDLTDVKKTTSGFHSFAQLYDTKYVPESSRFDWDGNRLNSPMVDYFDLTDIKKTTSGFHSFAQLYDTKYVPESSQFDWDGNRLNSPIVDYFDLTSIKKTTSGFHSFAQLYDTKYIPESSQFDWDGDRLNAPVSDYFDLTDVKKTSAGFHSFAQLYDTKYLPESSQFDWDGNAQSSLQNFVDLFQNTNADGFKKFATPLISEYKTETSRFDWDGDRTKAPNVNYFDLTDVKKTSSGFHSFAQLYDTKYVPESSQFDWDGDRLNAPITDYFDLTNVKKTSSGFHSFAQLYDTKYVPESSQFDWDGNRTDARTLDYFDLTDVKKTTSGFHSFAQLYDTKYVAESSQFDWDGNRTNVKTVDYFDLNSIKKTTSGFHPFAQLYDTKYVPESSQFDWDGDRFSSPIVDYFDLSNPKKTTIGFNKFAQLNDTKYVPESSQFDWDGNKNNAPTVNYFDLSNPQKTTAGFHSLAQTYDSKFVNDVSNYQWKGFAKDAPSVDYFDLNKRITFRGFHTLSQEREPTAYKNDLAFILPDVSRFDWDGGNPYDQRPTRFFGYNQTETFGFVIKMNKLDGTLFPIIKPEFKYDIAIGVSQTINRDSLSALRTQSEPLQTSDIEKYVPNALGNKFISGKKSSLDNQIPVVNIQKLSFDITQYRIRGTSPSFKRYTEGGGVNEQPSFVDGNMELWANSDITTPQPPPQPGPIFGNQTAAQIIGLNRSAPVIVYNKDTAKTQIDRQYLKYNLVEEAYNTDPIYLQPYIDTSLNGVDRDITLGLRINDNIRARLNSSYDLKLFNLNIPDNVRSFVGSSFDYVRDAYNSILPTLQSYRSFDEGLVRGGAVQHTIRTLLDAKRITKFLLSTKGVLWNLKQFGLQFMNPMQDTDTGFLGIPGALGLPGGALGFNWTSIYNPLSIPANILGKSILINSKFTRHGVLMYGEGAYEDIAVNRNDNTDNRPFDDFTRPSIFNRTSDYNRLVSLTKELLPNSYESITLKKEAENPSFLESVASLAVDFRDNLFTILGIGGRWNGLPTQDGRTTIRRLSTPFGGPNSVLGLFGTTINRATHPYKGINSTGYFPTKDSIIEGKDREVFYSGKDGYELRYTDIKKAVYNKYADNSGDESIHGQFVKNYVLQTLGTKVGDYSDGVQKILANRIEKSRPFEFRYQSFSERIKANPVVYGIGTMETQNAPLGMDIHDKAKFRTAPYQNLRRFDFAKKDWSVSDFRTGIEGVTDSDASTFTMDPLAVSLNNNSVETRFGFGNPGHSGRKRNVPYLSNVKYSSLLSDKELGRNENGEYQINSNYKYEAYPAIKSNTPSWTGNAPILGSDRINIIDWKRSTKDLNRDHVYEMGPNIYNDVLNPGTEDLIQFYFSGVNLKGAEYQPTETIVFRAYLDTIVDNHKPTWSPIKYIGRADPVYAYDGYERDINFGFTVHIGSRDELKASWRKLNMLASWTAPEYIDSEEFGVVGSMKAPVIRLNIGNLYRKFPGFLSSLTYTFDNTQTTWETAKLKEDKILTGDIGELSKPGALELPKTINVQCTFVPFNIYRPEWDCVFYSLFDDETGGTSVETGLVPRSDDRVNYFKTHDDLPSEHPMNQGLCALVPEPRPVQETPPEETPKQEVAVVVEEKPKFKCGCRIIFHKDEERYPVQEATIALEQLADWLTKDCPNANIELGGHASQEMCIDQNGKPIKGCKPTDNNREYNKLLSKYRADTIRNLLVSDYGIAYNRLTTAGYGYEELLDKTNARSQRNRRIEIKITNPTEAACDITLNLNCVDQTGCPTSQEKHRRDLGDGSELWIVGPGHYTEGPFDSIPAGEDPTRYDRSPADNKYYRSILDNWKVKWQNNSYRIATYYVSKRSRVRTGGFATWRPDPNS